MENIPDELAQAAVIFGSTASQGEEGWTRNTGLPTQYCVRTVRAAELLIPAAIIPVALTDHWGLTWGA
jgi:hypothetical protein